MLEKGLVPFAVIISSAKGLWTWQVPFPCAMVIPVLMSHTRKFQSTAKAWPFRSPWQTLVEIPMSQFSIPKHAILSNLSKSFHGQYIQGRFWNPVRIKCLSYPLYIRESGNGNSIKLKVSWQWREGAKSKDKEAEQIVRISNQIWLFFSQG